MNFKKILAFVLATATLLLFSACQPKPAESNNSGQNTDNDGSSTAKTLVLGTNAAFPPFEFVAEQGSGVAGGFDGIDILIGMEIAKDMGYELKVENMEFEAILPAVATGKADMALAGMTIKPDRLENADFSDPYWVAVQTIIVPEANTEITNVESLRGKKVGVITGYTGDSALSDKGFKDELQRYKKGVDAVMDLKNGKLDAVVIDSPTASRFIQKFGGLKAVNDDAAFEKEEYAIGVKKGNTELLEKINATIKRLKENGDIERFAEEVDARLG